MLRVLLAALCAAFVATFNLVSPAAAYPDRPIKLIVPFPPGGGADAIGRLVGQHLSKELGQNIVIVNRPGANGNIGSEYVAKAEPDGYTLLINTVGLVFSQSIYKRLQFNVMKDFAPIVLVANSPHVLVVGPSSKAKSVSDLIADAKANPGKLNCASVGIGSPFQMAAELFKSTADIKFAMIPFQGGGPAVLSVIAGQTDMTFGNLLATKGFIASGKLRALAVTGVKRSPVLPNVPTMAEAGLKGYDFNSWFGIWAPAGTPKPIIDALNRGINKVLHEPDLQKVLVVNGAEVAGGTAADFDAYLKAEYAKWDKVIKTAGITVK